MPLRLEFNIKIILMKTLQMVILLLFVASSFAGAASATDLAADLIAFEQATEQAVDSQEAVQESASSSFSMDNLWSLTEKAGPLRWPIFVVFVIGVFLVCFKLFELMADQRESREIDNMDFRTMGLQQIVRSISNQRESMLSRLHAIMLNVFQSATGSG